MLSHQFPIGPFDAHSERSSISRARAIQAIANLPRELARAVENLTDDQLAASYRDGGWSIRQIVHHLADSHSVGIVRFKLGLTEDAPTMSKYDQDRFARLPDVHLPVDVSLRLIDAVHMRWSTVLASVTDNEFRRVVTLSGGRLSLDDIVHKYAWHGHHHLAHISIALDATGAAGPG
jgi:uncharacterized damage-inducible protein DinB